MTERCCFWGECECGLCPIKNCLLQRTESVTEPASEVTSGLQTKTACRGARSYSTFNLHLDNQHQVVDSAHMHWSQDVAQHEAPQI